MLCSQRMYITLEMLKGSIQKPVRLRHGYLKLRVSPSSIVYSAGLCRAVRIQPNVPGRDYLMSGDLGVC